MVWDDNYSGFFPYYESDCRSFLRDIDHWIEKSEFVSFTDEIIRRDDGCKYTYAKVLRFKPEDRRDRDYDRGCKLFLDGDTWTISCSSTMVDLSIDVKHIDYGVSSQGNL